MNFQTEAFFLLFAATRQEKGTFILRCVALGKKLSLSASGFEEKKVRWMARKMQRWGNWKREEWGQKRQYWKWVVGRCWIECVTNKWWALPLDSNVIGYTSPRHYPQYSWRYRGAFLNSLCLMWLLRLMQLQTAIQVLNAISQHKLSRLRKKETEGRGSRWDPGISIKEEGNHWANHFQNKPRQNTTFLQSHFSFSLYLWPTFLCSSIFQWRAGIT